MFRLMFLHLRVVPELFTADATPKIVLICVQCEVLLHVFAARKALVTELAVVFVVSVMLSQVEPHVLQLLERFGAFRARMSFLHRGEQWKTWIVAELLSDLEC